MSRIGLSLAFLLMALSARGDELGTAMSQYRAGNYAAALPLMRELAGQGIAAAQLTLGESYHAGHGGQADLNLAMQWFKRAAEANYVPAQISLAEHYESGAGVVQDLDMAERWFVKAATSKDGFAQLQLGLFYVRLNTPSGFEQAAPALQAAAEKGLRDAQYFLARLYLDGKGVEADRALAMLWMSRASAQGHIAAQRFLYLLKQADTPETGLAMRELRRNLAAGEAQLSGVASDAQYGYGSKQPIKTGLGFEAEWRYLNALRGPQGEAVHYERLGHCCEFVSERAENGKAFLDQYRVRYTGLPQPVTLYLNMFEEAQPLAPQGFSYAPKIEE